MAEFIREITRRPNLRCNRAAPATLIWNESEAYRDHAAMLTLERSSRSLIVSIDVVRKDSSALSKLGRAIPLPRLRRRY
jgi:hypothetical protein